MAADDDEAAVQIASAWGLWSGGRHAAIWVRSDEMDVDTIWLGDPDSGAVVGRLEPYRYGMLGFGRGR